MGMLLISVYVLDPFQRLCSFTKWDNGVSINPEDEAFYISQYQEAFLKDVGNEYCIKHQHMTVMGPKSLLISTPIPTVMPSEFCQSSFDPNDLSSDEQYFTHTNVAETTPREVITLRHYWPLPSCI
jgi:hypothetical protein